MSGDIAQAVHELLNGVTDLSGKVYPLVVPDDIALPAAAYQVISDVPEYAHDGPVPLSLARIQLTLHAASYSAGVELLKTVQTAISGYKGTLTTSAVELQHVFIDRIADAWGANFLLPVQQMDLLIRYTVIAVVTVTYALRDDFTDTRVAGAVNGTDATPGPGVRAVTDAGGRLSVSDGAARIATGAGTVSLALGSALTRQAGLLLRQVVQVSSLTGAVGCGWVAGGLLEGVVFANGSLIAAQGEALATAVSSGRVIGACGPGVYEVFTVLRAAGAWLFVRGGRWLEPTLVYTSVTGSAATVAPVTLGDTRAFDTWSWAVPEDGLITSEIPAPVASDSFNRPSLENTDGAGHAEANGGSGLPWIAQIGTWGISSNKARALMTVSSQAVATVETGASDVLIEGKLETTGGWVGFTFRYVDANNYCMARISTSYLRVYKRVAGVESQVASTGITYASGARLVVRVEGDSVTAVYNGTTALTATISDLVFVGQTKHGLFAGTAGSVINVDNLVIWALTDYAGVDRTCITSAGQMIEVYREDATNFLVTLPLSESEDDLLRARWRLAVVQGAWFLNGVEVVDWGGRAAPVVFVNNASSFEYAFKLGATGDLEADFDFVGTNHGNQTLLAVTIELDGLDISTLPVGAVAYGTELDVTQSISDLYPKDGVTVAGVTTLQQVFTGAGVTVDVSHVFNSDAAWEVYTHYGLMLPATDAGADLGQVEGSAPVTLNYNDGRWLLTGSLATWVELSSTVHDYAIRASMPSGGPNTDGDWSNSGSLKIGIQDRGDGINKGYAFNITSTFASRVAVAGSTIASQTIYIVKVLDE